jgi:flavin-dependent dehydrogenase
MYDVLVIGAGPAGLMAVRRLAKSGRRVVEKEIESGPMLRKSVKLIGDCGIERLMASARTNGVESLIRNRVDFDWHRDLIRAVFRHSSLGPILLGHGSGSRSAYRKLQECSPV